MSLAAREQRRETEDERPGHVEQGEAVDDLVARAHRIHLRGSPARVQLVAMRVLGQLRRACGAAGVKQRRDGIRLNRTAKLDRLPGLTAPGLLEVDRVRSSADGDDVPELATFALQCSHLRPDVERVVGARVTSTLACAACTSSQM
jgi:hypothetical protein